MKSLHQYANPTTTSGPDGTKWWTAFVGGAPFHLESGMAGTLNSLNGHDPSWFPFESTVILGDAGKRAPRNSAQHTTAHWSIPTSGFPIPLFTRGYLLIGCLRRFGGLHSKVFMDKVELRLNGIVLDGFELAYVPAGHKDFFHTVPYPNVPKPPPFADCENLYSWSVPKSHLREEPEQQFLIRLDRDVRWDIDFIGFLFEIPTQLPQLFISHNHKDKPLARRLAKDLRKCGINVWIDEAEIKLGDSLLRKIEEGINLVDYLVVLISRNSIGSAWVNQEVEIAMNQEIAGKRVKVVVILMDAVELPSFLRTKKYADLRDLANYRKVLNEIKQRVRA